MDMLAKNVCWFGGVFCGYRWQKLELPDFKFGSVQEKSFVLISIILCAESVATYATLDQILCLMNA